MSEGSLDAPTRHPIAWQDPDFADPAKLDAEMRRVFDICHGCRRCFNLCDSFPRLFDLIDNSPSEDVEQLDSEDFKPVVEACTLCDMCFMTKCPYVPPHRVQARFPASDAAPPLCRGEERGKTDFMAGELAEDGPQRRAGAEPWRPIVNWAVRARQQADAAADGEDRRHRSRWRRCRNSTAAPSSCGRESEQARAQSRRARLRQRKAALYATCFVNYNKPETGMAAPRRAGHHRRRNRGRLSRLLRHAVRTGRARQVAESAAKVSENLLQADRRGLRHRRLTPSCGLMLKFEWPLIVPEMRTSRSSPRRPSTSTNMSSTSPRRRPGRRA